MALQNSTSPTTTEEEPPAAAAVQDEPILCIPGAFLHLIDKHRSLELSTGSFSLHRLSQPSSPNPFLALSASVISHGGDEEEYVQWPITRDTIAVKLDSAHYFFSLPILDDGGGDKILLNYGLTLASRDQEALLAELDRILESHCSFSVHSVNEKSLVDVLDVSMVEKITAVEVAEAGPKKEMMEERSAAYWTTLAPNVEDYSGMVAKGIAMGSGQVVKGIIWCGDVTVERIRWGNEFLMQRMAPGDKAAEISPEILQRIKRVKAVTRMTEKVATGVLTGVVKVSGYFRSSVANSTAGKKIISLIPGEIVLASLDGFGKICDAVEAAGKSVLSTSSTVTTGLVSYRYGEQAAEAACEGLDAAGHAVGTAWTVFKIRKAIDPKSTIKPTNLAESAAKAAAEIKAKQPK